MTAENLEPETYIGRCTCCGADERVDSYGYCVYCQLAVHLQERAFTGHYGTAIKYRGDKVQEED